MRVGGEDCLLSRQREVFSAHQKPGLESGQVVQLLLQAGKLNLVCSLIKDKYSGN